MHLKCDDCAFFDERSRHCTNAYASKWGNVSMSLACGLFKVKQQCSECDACSVCDGGCTDARSGRMGVVKYLPRCEYFRPVRTGDKRGGFLTNIDDEERK